MVRRAPWTVLLTGAIYMVLGQAPVLPGDADLLHAAVRSGKIDEAQKLLDRGVPVNIFDAVGSTPLHDAAWSGDAQMVHFLLVHGANVNIRHSEAGSTPLHYAILTGRPAVVKELLDAG